MLAWGFHFPVRTYLDKVDGILSERGVVILDIRKQTDGIEVLKSRFAHVRTIRDRRKEWRVAAARDARLLEFTETNGGSVYE